MASAFFHGACIVLALFLISSTDCAPGKGQSKSQGVGGQAAPVVVTSTEAAPPAKEGNGKGANKGGQNGNKQSVAEGTTQAPEADSHGQSKGQGNANNQAGANGQGKSGNKRAQDDDNDYQQWKNSHGRKKQSQTDDDNDDVAYGKYKKNRDFVDEQKKKKERGEVTFDVKLNSFADKDPEELASTLLGYKPKKHTTLKPTITPKGTTKRTITITTTRRPTTARRTTLRTTTEPAYYEAETEATTTQPPPTTTLPETSTIPTTTTTLKAISVGFPDSLDWRTKGAVSDIRYQQECGACWAFSAAACLEGRLALKTGKMVPLSPQNLLDCSSSYGNEGCAGGEMKMAFDYVKAVQGENSYDAYPYIGKENGKCLFNNSAQARYGPISGYVEVQDKNETALIEALQSGPVSAAMDAGLSSFYYYSSGVYYDAMCDPSSPNHAVLIIGYGVDSATNEKYWLVKNTWGVEWGLLGYTKILRGRNACGIESGASYPILA